MATKFTKTPEGVLNYQVTWTQWIGADTINDSAWEIDPSGLTIDSQDATLTTTTLIVSGGTAGTEYSVTNTITTAGGLVTSRTFKIEIVEQRIV